MILQEDVDFLEHFGKKGMKWGVRKTQTRGRSHKQGRAEKAINRQLRKGGKAYRAADKDKALNTTVKLVAGGVGFIAGKKLMMSTPLAAVFGAATAATVGNVKTMRDAEKNLNN